MSAVTRNAKQVDVPIVVVGAGAAGVMAALFAAQGKRPVLLLERTADGGRKILISGGGRCNILPSHMKPQQFVTASSPNSLKNILRSWPLDQQRKFFESEAGIGLALEEETGKLFPVSNSARQVRDSLYNLARHKGVQLRFGARVSGVAPDTDQSWRVELSNADTLRASAVILATGGQSVPATGSDGCGYEWMRRLGHRVHAPYPALTPLTCNPVRHALLAGVSLPVHLEAVAGSRRALTQGGFLFTHRGYSGPAVLDLSHIAVQGKADGESPVVRVQWTSRNSTQWDTELLRPGGSVLSRVRRHLPERLAEALVRECGLPLDKSVSQLQRQERRRLVTALTCYSLPVTGDEGFKKAEVTGGGIDLGEVNPRTMESRLHPGLFLCGEILDAFGPIGGYNFVWAWVTGRLAGLGTTTWERAAG